MSLGKTFNGILLLAAAAIVGLALLYIPGWVIDKYKVVAGFGAFWGWLYLAVVAVGASLFLGSMFTVGWRLWNASRVKVADRERRSRNPSQLSNSQKASEIEENLRRVQEMRSRNANDPRVAEELQPLLDEVERKRERQTLEIVAFGTISSGKSSVLNLLAGRNLFATDARGGTTVTRNEVKWERHDRVILVDTPGLGEVDGEQHVWIAAESAKDADLVLLVVDGPLRESEHRLLKKLGEMEKRIIICLNKSDWYEASDRDRLLNQLRQQCGDWVSGEEVVSIQAQTGSRTRKRVASDGSTIDETVPIEPDIAPLADRMLAIVRSEGKELVMANILLQSRGLVEKAKQRVRESIDRKAWEIVERNMWQAGGIAAVNPFPIIDLVAGMGISTKMIIDLAHVYDQRVDLQTASKWMGEMAKILVGVLGSQGSTVAAAALVSSLIKSVPIAGTLVGNAMQGAIQALLTRWVGSVFIEYFGNEMHHVDGGLANVARRQWGALTTADELRKLVIQARQKLSGNTEQ